MGHYRIREGWPYPQLSQKRIPELGEGFMIQFYVDSAAAEKDLNDQKVDLLSFLRKKLSNYKLNLTVSIGAADSANSVPYTPSEKFKKAGRKNPLLHELKKIRSWNRILESQRLTGTFLSVRLFVLRKPLSFFKLKWTKNRRHLVAEMTSDSARRIHHFCKKSA